MEKSYKTIVVGLGAMGSAALYQLSKSNEKILGIDRFEPPHKNGSSHGQTRVTRQAIGEGSHYVPLVLKSNEIWRELESASGTNLLTQCGGLIFGSEEESTMNHGVEGFLSGTIQTAKDFNIKHRVLDYTELVKSYPQFNFSKNEVGYFEPGAGYLFPEKCIDAQLKLAKSNGADIILSLIHI